MQLPLHQHCFNHNLREAVARCPACGNYYCRECVTEHDDRMMCSNCLKEVVNAVQRRKGRIYDLLPILIQGFGGWLMLCYAFYLMGKLLLTIPIDFHEGTVWKDNGWGGG